MPPFGRTQPLLCRGSGPGPGGASGPPPGPGCFGGGAGPVPAKDPPPKLQRYFGPPSAPSGPAGLGPPPAALAPAPSGLRLPLRGTARLVPRALARPIGAGALRVARLGAPPGAAACGRRLAPGPAPCGWPGSGSLGGWRFARPPGLCARPCVGWAGLGPPPGGLCAPAAAPAPPPLAPAQWAGVRLRRPGLLAPRWAAAARRAAFGGFRRPPGQRIGA